MDGGKKVVALEALAFKRVSGGGGAQESPPKQGETPRLQTLLSAHLVETYRRCSNRFLYSSNLNPRRVLTKPSEGVANDNYDNVNADYVLYVNDIIGSYSNHQYQVLDFLGSGTFGQVVKCINIASREQVAIKIVKNKPAYFNQGLVEIQILEMLNHQYDPENNHHIVRLQDYFVFHNHLCLVFELLNINLYELIKQNQFRGLSMKLIRCFMLFLLDGLSVMHKANVIHCDLKPENILLENLTSPSIKIIDFGSACFENSTVYTYIQSRFYRSPEVLIGVKYDSAIDMWSLGCISAELFLGLPLFPGASEYNQLFRIIDMLGPFPERLLERGAVSKVNKYFNKIPKPEGGYTYEFKSDEQMARETGTEIPPSKKYFKYKTLPEIIDHYTFKEGMPPDELQREKANRRSFANFLLGLLVPDPEARWTPEEAKLHPFITGEPFTGNFVPPPRPPRITLTAPRVIPWGIQNAPQQAASSARVSMSYPENFEPESFTPQSYKAQDFFAMMRNANSSAQQQQQQPPPLHLGSLTGHYHSPYHSPRQYMDNSPRGMVPPHHQVHYSGAYLPSGPYSPRQYLDTGSNHPPEVSPRQYQMSHQQMYQQAYGSQPQTMPGMIQVRRQRSKSDISPSKDNKLFAPRFNGGQRSPRGPAQPQESKSNVNGYAGKKKKFPSWGHQEGRQRANTLNTGPKGPSKHVRRKSSESSGESASELQDGRSSSDSTHSNSPSEEKWDDDELLFELDPDTSPQNQKRTTDNLATSMSGMHIGQNKGGSHSSPHVRSNATTRKRAPSGSGGYGAPAKGYAKPSKADKYEKRDFREKAPKGNT